MQNSMAEQAFDQIVQDLHGEGRLRVWSIIITVFGDLMPAGRPDLPASVLQSVLDRLGIDGGTVRTAISRLAKDGWIARERAGRNISYKLTNAARPAFDVASRTIYAPSRPEPAGPLTLLIWPDRAEPPDLDRLLPVRRGVKLWTGGKPLPEIATEALVVDLTDKPLPEWAITQFADPDLAAAHHRLAERFAPLHKALEGDALNPLDSAAARVALTHAWRRLALRHPLVPDSILPTDWPEPDTRRFVRTVYRQLARPVATWQAEHLPVTVEGASG